MDRASLIVAVSAGQSFDYLLFWGHRQKEPGEVDASCLSQWFPAPFSVDGVRYATAEHWMMASKARLFGDDDALARIVAAETPDAAKRLGRLVRDYDDARWAAARFDAVLVGSLAKFRAHKSLRRFLDDTGDRVLVEASPFDTIWGIGLGGNAPAATDPRTWRGENLLGFALMQAREALRANT